MRKGFTLIELLVVIAIMAMLVGVAAPYFADYVKDSRISKAKADLDVLKQAVVLYNSREDIPYQGPIASTSPFLPMFGETDFVGLQGQYLTNIPVDPWGKNYKLDPYGGFVYSEAADSNSTGDDIRDYYIKELSLRRIEWEDTNNNRVMDTDDLLYVYFNKALYRAPTNLSGDFEVYENNQVMATLSFGLDFPTPTGYSQDTATSSLLLCKVTNTNTVKLGVHAIALRDTLAVLQEYKEVVTDRKNSNTAQVRTKIETNPVNGKALRFAVRTNPIKITPKN